MKRYLKILSVMLSAVILFCLVFSVPAAAADYTQEEVDKAKLEYAIRNTLIIGGGYVTPESLEAYNSAQNYAQQVYGNPNATQQEVDKAIEMLYSSSLVETEFNTEELNRYYYIIDDLYNNNFSKLTAESQEIISDVIIAFHSYVCMFKCRQSQVDEMTAELEAAVNKLEYISLADARSRAKDLAQAYCDTLSEPGSGYELGEFSNYKYGQYLLIQAKNLMPSPMMLNARIDGYLIESDKVDMGFLVVNYITGEVIPLDYALENRLIDIDDFYKYYCEVDDDDMKFIMCVVGDCDNDNTLTVKDATNIQKGIVGLLSIDALKLTVLERDNQVDVNNDGEVDVKDATQIQRMIVGLE